MNQKKNKKFIVSKFFLLLLKLSFSLRWTSL